MKLNFSKLNFKLNFELLVQFWTLNWTSVNWTFEFKVELLKLNFSYLNWILNFCPKLNFSKLNSQARKRPIYFLRLSKPSLSHLDYLPLYWLALLLQSSLYGLSKPLKPIPRPMTRPIAHCVRLSEPPISTLIYRTGVHINTSNKTYVFSPKSYIYRQNLPKFHTYV